MKNAIFDIDHDQGFELRTAVAIGDMGRVTTLLETGAKVDVLQNAPVRWAVRHRHATILGMLLEHGATIDSYEDELVMVAASNGDARTSSASSITSPCNSCTGASSFFIFSTTS